MSVTDNRPSRTTPNLGLPVPGDADPADAPGDIGALADVLDALAARGVVGWAPGDLKVSASAAPGDGWLLCDGRAVSRSVYAALFAAIQATYGPGDGSTTFALPDYRGRVIMGAGPGPGLTNRPLGASGGAENVALTAAQSGVNGNGISGFESLGHTHGAATGVGFIEAATPANVAAWIATGTTGVRIAPSTSGQSNPHQHALLARNADESHPNMPPWATANVFIKT